MLANPSGKFERLVSELLINDKYLKAIQQAHRTYNVRQFNIKELKPNNILQTYYQISSRFYGANQASNENNWHQNQLKIFIWLVVGYCYLQNRNILQMTEDDWLFFSQIFKCQTPRMLEYQSLLIIKRKNKPAKWTKEEINLLNSIIKKNNRKNMWKQTARNLYMLSQRKFFRTAKQCREYWINHLDPIPLKTSWQPSQDIQLIQWTYFLKKKWSKISKLFGGRRTEHMVKNRFNSLYHFELKRYSQSSCPTQQQVMLSLKQRLKLLVESSKKTKQTIRTVTDFTHQGQALDQGEDLRNESCISFYKQNEQENNIEFQQYAEGGHLLFVDSQEIEGNQNQKSRQSHAVGINKVQNEKQKIQEIEDPSNSLMEYSYDFTDRVRQSFLHKHQDFLLQQ